MPFVLIGFGIFIGVIAFSGIEHRSAGGVIFGIIGILIFLIGITEKSKIFNFGIRLYYITIGLFLCFPIIQSINKSLNFL